MTTIKLTGGDLGGELILVRCDLAEASAPVQVDYDTGHGWEGTQYQCADTRHYRGVLIEIAKGLAAEAVEMRYDDFDCDVETAKCN